jgi:hypothetical protein
MVAPFFEFSPSRAALLPLFNGISAYLYFEIFSKAPSISATTVSGDGQQLCQRVIPQ